jgi:hypothetical protein
LKCAGSDPGPAPICRYSHQITRCHCATKMRVPRCLGDLQPGISWRSGSCVMGCRVQAKEMLDTRWRADCCADK